MLLITGITHAVLSLALVADFCLSVIFLCYFFAFPFDVDIPPSFEALPTVDVSYVYLQFFASICTVALSWLCMNTAMSRESDKKMYSNYLIVAVLKLLTLACDLIQVYHPTIDKQVWMTLVISFHLGVLCLVGFGVVCTIWFVASAPVDPDEVNTEPDFRQHFQDKDGRPSLQRLERFLNLRSVRQSIRTEFYRGNKYLFWACLGIAVLTSASFFGEYKKFTKSQESFFDKDRLVEFKDGDAQKALRSYYGVTPQQKTIKVLLVVVSGLRYDMIEKNTDFANFMGTSPMKEDSRVFKAFTPLPSLSVPGWVSMLTGLTPELSGVTGDTKFSETPFDTIFHSARRMGLTAGATGSPWLLDQFKSTFPPLQGDGTVSPDFELEPFTTSAGKADRRRAVRMMEGIKNPFIEYNLFMAQYSDPDLQATAYGVTKEYNREDTYQTAVSNTIKFINQAVTTVDDNTVVLITSDHGHLDRGGSGGNEPENLEVPLIVFQGGSNMGGKKLTAAPRFNADPIMTMDLAPTISALLGVPVPRTNQGVFIDDILLLANEPKLGVFYKDLFFQQQYFVRTYLTIIGHLDVIQKNTVLTATMQDSSIKDYRDGVLVLRKLYADERFKVWEETKVRNIVLSAMGCISALVCLIYIVQRFTFADISLVLSPWPHLYVNRTAFLTSLAGVIGFYVCTVLAFLTIMKFRGYPAWDSTIVDDPTNGFVFFVDSLVPATVFAIVLMRIYHFPFVRTWGQKKGEPFVTRFLKGAVYYMAHAIAGSEPNYVDVSALYLCKVYTLLLTLGMSMVIFTLQGGFAYIIPDAYTLGYIMPSHWAERFQLATLQLMTMPLLLLSLLLLIRYPGMDLSTAAYDKLYSLSLQKNKAATRQGRGLDIIGLLEEESDSLLDNGFSSINA